MTAPTDLRAALRDAAEMLESYSEIGFTSERSAARAMSARLVALADAPPTVAELLERVDATHRVEWDDCIGRPCAATLVGAVVAFWWGPGFAIPCALRPSDLIRPGRLVEVSP